MQEIQDLQVSAGHQVLPIRLCGLSARRLGAAELTQTLLLQPLG